MGWRLVCYRLCLALRPSPKYYVWVRGSLVREYPAAAGSIISLGKGVVSFPIPLDLKNCPTASFDVLFIQSATTVVPVVDELIIIVLNRPKLARPLGVGVPSLARGLLAPSAARVGRIPVSVALSLQTSTGLWNRVFLYPLSNSMRDLDFGTICAQIRFSLTCQGIDLGEVAYLAAR
jgi:hypothetical protein